MDKVLNISNFYTGKVLRKNGAPPPWESEMRSVPLVSQHKRSEIIYHPGPVFVSMDIAWRADVRRDIVCTLALIENSWALPCPC
jgi:hypothetical protein